jgi:hypothetical protein
MYITATRHALLALLLLSLAACDPAPESNNAATRAATLTLGENAARGVAELGLDVPIVGRAFLIVAREGEDEPRLGTGPTGNPLWGVDVRDLSAGDAVRVTAGAPGMRGYPLAAIEDLPPGDYRVQAFLNVYTTFRRADGHVIEAHLNSGAFQDPFRAPGNVYSDVQRLTVSANGEWQPVSLLLEHVIQPERPLADGEVLQQGNPQDTDWVRYVKIRSNVLSEFWGRDMYIGANVLLPAGYDEHPDAVYPVLYLQGHSSSLTPVPWSPEEWFKPGYQATNPGVANQLDGFYEAWTSGALSKFVVITFRDANPYFDTSYSVDTENVGPYGTALTEELMPHLEEKFRIVQQPWGRVLSGRSTGGWEAAAMMIFYPDLFAGSWPWAPDPIDFRKLMQINIYESRTAYWNEFDWIRTLYPGQRETDGLVNYATKNEYDYEQAVGNKDRSAGQWAIWQALYSPVGEDGYPVPLWDPVTGVIDKSVAAHWREHWDLSYILARDWPELGERLRGKLHFAVGRMDNYYLEQAVYLTEDRVRELKDPPADATFQYGTRARHSWIGHSPIDPGRQMTYAEFINVIADFVRSNAPPDADLESWNY